MFGRGKRIDRADNYLYYGEPGATFHHQRNTNLNAQNVGAGDRGELILFDKLRNDKDGWLPADIPLFCSLLMPRYGNQDYDVDIDFAAVMGSRILLIDAKMYRQDGGFYWNRKSDRSVMKKNLSTYTNSRGEEVKLKRSAVMALDRVAHEFRGYTVASIVVFVTDPFNPKAKVPHTGFLRYPGNIPVYTEKTAPKYIYKFFNEKHHTRTNHTLNAERKLSTWVQGDNTEGLYWSQGGFSAGSPSSTWG